MANSDKDILITPGRGTANLPEISFVGLDNAPIKLRVLDDNALSWEGSAGQLFSINNNLTSGSIFSVNDVSGIPSIDVNANGAVSLAPYNGNVAVGHTSPSVKLHVKGNVAGATIARVEDGTLDITDSLNQTSAQLSVTNSNNAFNQQLLNLNYSGANTSDNYNAINVQDAGTQTFRVRGDGLVTSKKAILVDGGTTSTISIGSSSVTANPLYIESPNPIKVNSTQTGTDKYYFDGFINGVGACFSVYRNGTTEFLNARQNFAYRANQLGGTGGKHTFSGGEVNLLTKLQANGDDQWLDTYGIFKSNRNTIAEPLTIPANTNCVSAGPITINTGITVNISANGSWSIV